MRIIDSFCLEKPLKIIKPNNKHNTAEATTEPRLDWIRDFMSSPHQADVQNKNREGAALPPASGLRTSVLPPPTPPPVGDTVVALPSLSQLPHPPAGDFGLQRPP